MATKYSLAEISSQRRNKLGIQLVKTPLGLLHSAQAKNRVALKRFSFQKQTQILPGNLHRFFSQPGILVAGESDFGLVAGIARLLPYGNVEPAIAMLWHGKEDFQRGLIRTKRLLDAPFARSGVGVGNIERQPVRKQSHGARKRQVTRGKRLVVDD